MAKSFGNYDNGIPKRLCTNCPYKKVSFGRDAWCKLYNKGNSVLGIYEWYDFPHPKCPLATMTYNKLLKLAHYYKHKDGWAYYEAKKLGLAIPDNMQDRDVDIVLHMSDEWLAKHGLVDSHKKDN